MERPSLKKIERRLTSVGLAILVATFSLGWSTDSYAHTFRTSYYSHDFLCEDPCDENGSGSPWLPDGIALVVDHDNPIPNSNLEDEFPVYTFLSLLIPAVTDIGLPEIRIRRGAPDGDSGSVNDFFDFYNCYESPDCGEVDLPYVDVTARDGTTGIVFDTSPHGFSNYSDIRLILPDGPTYRWHLGGWERGATTEIPEPGTLALLGLGLAGIGFARRRKA